MKEFILFVALIATATAFVAQKLPKGPGGRVVGGQPAIPYSADYIVALEWVNILGDEGELICAGSIVDPYFVVTAANCLTNLPATGRLEVSAGRHDLSDSDEDSEQRRIGDYFILHKDFTPGRRGENNNISPHDIALIHLDEAFEWTDDVGNITLPDQYEDATGYAYLYGWGSTSHDGTEFPRTLHSASVPIISQDECDDHTIDPDTGRNLLTSGMLCTGPLVEGGISACIGDAGGPLMMYDSNYDPELIGIASWGFLPCGTIGAPSVFTRASHYSDWVYQTIRDTFPRNKPAN